VPFVSFLGGHRHIDTPSFLSSDTAVLLFPLRLHVCRHRHLSYIAQTLRHSLGAASSSSGAIRKSSIRSRLVRVKPSRT
jgi:hypothetical protein